MSHIDDREELIDRHLRGELSESEKERLAALLDSDPAARKQFVEHAEWDTWIAETLREDGDAAGLSEDLIAEPSARSRETPSVNTLLRLLLAVSAVVIVALSIGLYYQQSIVERRIAEITENNRREDYEPTVARITGLSGALIWTGDRGQIVRELSVGTELAGGTIEGVAPDSWFELEFHDGSTVMIAGNSMLTFSDLGQKVLRLKSGNLSANITSQPADKPLLRHTQSALLRVLGTRFDVEAGLSSTSLNVSEGTVRVQRLSDGRLVDVPANHRVIAAADRDMLPVEVPDSVHRWKSQLHLGPNDTYGTWLPATDLQPATLKAIPFVPRENQSVTLYLLGLPVFRADSSPVIVQSNSRFAVRGRLETAADVYFGIRLAHPNGEFAGKFLARRPADSFQNQSDFEVAFRLEEFDLDPCVWDRKDELPSRPDQLVLTGVWSFTHTGGPTGLEVTEVELIAP